MELDVTAQQFVILGKDSMPGGELAPIGARREVLAKLGRLNTWPERNGEDVLYGPGICIQVPPEIDPITQMLIGVTEEEIAWQVIQRLIRKMECKLLDPATGREFSG